MDIGLSLRYVFKDEAWFKKLVIPALWGLIPVVGVLILGGWGLKVAKQVIEGRDEHILPKVELMADLRRGFLAGVIDLIYILPAGIFAAISAVLITFSQRTPSIAQWILMILGGLFALIGLLSLILWFLFATVAFANFLATDRFGAAFNFRALIQLLRNAFSSWLVLILGQLLGMLIIAPMGSILCGVGILFTTAYAAVVYAHLLGQAYTQSVSPAGIQ